MPPSISPAVLAGIRRAAHAGPAEAGPSDGRLLSQFVACRDQEAFAALVDRHGPMVLAVCRRAAGDPHLADDAYQAAFLVLARRAGDIRPADAVRPWLHGVAVRTASEARRTAARRRAREIPVPLVPERPAPSDPPTDSDALRLLDEEIARLPGRLRAAVVMCELGGVGRKAAAERLGVPEGTLSSRLAQARKVLAGRLRGRGVTPSAAGLSAFLGATAAARVPAGLAETAAGLAGSRSAPVAAEQLANGVLQVMLMNKLKAAAAGLVLAVAVGWTAVAGMSRADGPPDRPAAVKPAAVTPADIGTVFFSCDERFYAIDAAGTNERRIVLPPRARGFAVPSPDGKMLASWTHAGTEAKEKAALWVRPADGKGEPVRFDLPEKFGFVRFVWSPDGASLFVNVGTPGVKGVRHMKADVTGQKIAPVEGLDTFLVTDWTRDGKKYLATSVGGGVRWEPKSIHLVNTDGTEPSAVTDPKDRALNGRLSPDGKRMLCINNDRLSVMDIGASEVSDAGRGHPERSRSRPLRLVAGRQADRLRDQRVRVSRRGRPGETRIARRARRPGRQERLGAPVDQGGADRRGRVAVTRRVNGRPASGSRSCGRPGRRLLSCPRRPRSSLRAPPRGDCRESRRTGRRTAPPPRLPQPQVLR